MKDPEDQDPGDQEVDPETPHYQCWCGWHSVWLTAQCHGVAGTSLGIRTWSLPLTQTKGVFRIFLKFRHVVSKMSFMPWLYGVFLVLVLVTPTAYGQTGDPLRYYIREEQSANTYVGNIVEDTGLTLGPMLRLELQAGQGSIGHRYFKLNLTTGILLTSGPIDREQLCPDSTQTCVLKLTVLQHSPFFHIIKIDIVVRDINDHAPTFPDERIARTISETTKPDTTFTIPVAEDPDSGVNGVQNYVLLSDTAKFALHFSNMSGTIIDLNLVLKEPLDREDEHFYSLVVTAKDGGSPAKTGSMLIEIVVGDANDNSPRFDNSTYEVTIPENVPEHRKILQVHAFDPDSGRNGDIVYGFGSDTPSEVRELFEINAISGGIFIKGEVDYEKGDVYHLIVTAEDLGENSLPAYAKVVVHVQDINDHAPHITVNSLDSRKLGSGESAFIREDLAAGTFVAHVSVTDPDDGQNGVVSCYLDSDFFEMRQMNTEGYEYQIISKVVFDREEKAERHIELSCSDHGRPHLSSRKDIVVKIQDVNDHEPHFQQQAFSVSMEENNEIDVVVIKANATDTDAGKNAAIKYGLVNQEDAKFLKVDPITGVIRATVSFDFEQQDRYEFVLSATDQGPPTHTATTTLVLNIIDINDERPIFTKPSYSFKIFENMPANMKVGIMGATDADSPPFNDIVYSLSPRSEGLDVFGVNPENGEMTTKRPLDREEKEVYHLRLIASNRGYRHVNTSVNVTVTVVDQNDNAPTFVFPTDWNNTVHVPDGIAIGEVVTRVVARDIDNGSNSDLTYAIVKGNESFAIESHSGVIKVIDQLQCLNSHICKLVVMVRDNGTPRRKATAELSVVPKSAKVLGHSLEAMFFLSGTNLTIIIAAAVVSLLLITLIIVIFCRRRRRRCDRKKECEEDKVIGMSDTHDSDFSVKSLKNGKLPNGCCDGVRGRPKKEVTFNMDNRGLRESSTDDLTISWPSKLDTAVIEFHNANYAGTASYASDPRSHSTSVGRCSGAASGGGPPAEVKLSAVAPWLPRHGTVHPQMGTPPLQRSSPIAPLTEMEIEMAEVLQMLSREHDSETGSITDSGRGPSEEGDNNRPSPLDPHLNDDHKGSRADGRKTGDGHSSDLLRSKSSELFASFKRPDCTAGKSSQRYMAPKRQGQTTTHIPPPPPPPTLSAYAGIMKHKTPSPLSPLTPIPQEDVIHGGMSSFKPSNGSHSNWPSHYDYQRSMDSNTSSVSSGPMSKFRYQGKRGGNDTRKVSSGSDVPYQTALSNLSSRQRTSPQRDSIALAETNLNVLNGQKVDSNGNKDKRTVNFNLDNLGSVRPDNSERGSTDRSREDISCPQRPSTLGGGARGKVPVHYGQPGPPLRVYDSSPSSRRPHNLEMPLVSPAGQSQGHQRHMGGQGSHGRGWSRDSNDGLSDDSTTTSGSYVINAEEAQRDTGKDPRTGKRFVV